MKIRLQKFIAECGIAARRKAEVLITSGKVTVNGKVVTELGTRVDPAEDSVKVMGQLLRTAERGIILLNKPRGVVCTVSDPEGRPTVLDYIGAKDRGYFPVGRLDVDSGGLMVLTNDGELAERLLHPRYEMTRVYISTVEGVVDRALLQRISQGVRLEDGMARAQCRIIKLDGESTVLEIVIKLGRNRIVRRLMEQVGHPVRSLRRVAHGPFNIGNLKSGEIRRLGETEYKAVRKKVLAGIKGGQRPASPANKRRGRA